MIRIAVVEDEQVYRNQLVGYLRKYQAEFKIPIEVKTYVDGDEIIEDFHCQFDVILLDIQMKFVDGMTTAEQIREVDSEVVLIFITNMVQYAIKGYAVNATDYILKPISYFFFSQKMNKIADKLTLKRVSDLVVKVKGGIRRIAVADILFIESQGHRLQVVTPVDQIDCSGTLSTLETQLKDYHFYRGNKCYLINLIHVDGIVDNTFADVKGNLLMISRNRKKGFLTALNKYWSDTL